MAMQMMNGLLGMGGMNSYCHMCASHYCSHTIQGLAAQQQLGSSHYNELVRLADNAGILTSHGTISATTSNPTNATIAGQPEPTLNKKLLLLRRAR